MSERKTTRFAVLEAERVVKVHEREIPALKADEVLIKNGACNICTTDYGQYTGARKNLMFPMAWGHEFAGTIVDMGSDVKEFEVGEMVGISSVPSAYYQVAMHMCDMRKVNVLPWELEETNCLQMDITEDLVALNT